MDITTHYLVSKLPAPKVDPLVERVGLFIEDLVKFFKKHKNAELILNQKNILVITNQLLKDQKLKVVTPLCMPFTYTLDQYGYPEYDYKGYIKGVPASLYFSLQTLKFIEELCVKNNFKFEVIFEISNVEVILNLTEVSLEKCEIKKVKQVTKHEILELCKSELIKTSVTVKFIELSFLYILKSFFILVTKVLLDKKFHEYEKTFKEENIIPEHFLKKGNLFSLGFKILSTFRRYGDAVQWIMAIKKNETVLLPFFPKGFYSKLPLLFKFNNFLTYNRSLTSEYKEMLKK